jgi:hypothetical protein
MLQLILQGIRGWIFSPTTEISLQQDGGVILLGDSLIYITVEGFELVNKIQTCLTHPYQLSYINCAQNGNMIHTIRQRFTKIEVQLRSMSEIYRKQIKILLLWDSDCSEVNETVLNISQIQSLRRKYTDHLKYILHVCTELQVSITVYGPALLPTANKTSMLEDYCQLNAAICTECGAEYVNIREVLLATELECPGSRLTVDGEHFNEQGAVIVAQLFAKAIEDWKQHAHSYCSRG